MCLLFFGLLLSVVVLLDFEETLLLSQQSMMFVCFPFLRANTCAADPLGTAF